MTKQHFLDSMKEKVAMYMETSTTSTVGKPRDKDETLIHLHSTIEISRRHLECEKGHSVYHVY